MQHLYAPWRMEYIKSAETPIGCVFCHLLADQRDEEHLILARGKTCFVLLNKYPYNPGHMMVIPLAHKGDLEALSPEEMLEFMQTTARMKTLLQAAMSPHGFNLGINLGRVAGAGVPDHVHIHLVPRWSGDSNFMPVLGETKVLPQALADTYRFLRAKLVEIEAGAGKPIR